MAVPIAIPCADGTCSYAAKNAKSEVGKLILINKTVTKYFLAERLKSIEFSDKFFMKYSNLARSQRSAKHSFCPRFSFTNINPHFSALQFDPIALSGAFTPKANS
jgi:hypothetical protein